MKKIVSLCLFFSVLFFFSACDMPPKNETTQEIVQDTISEAGSETATETISELKADGAPEPSAEASPEPSAEASPEQSAEASPEQSAEASPEQSAETSPESSPERVVESGPCTWQKTKTLSGHTGPVRGVAFNGTQVISASDDRTVKVWDINTGTTSTTLTNTATMDGVAAAPISASSPYNRYIAAAAIDKFATVWDLSTGGQKYRLGAQTAAAKSVAFQNNGQLLASGTSDGSIYLYDLSNGTRKEILSHAIIGSVIIQSVSFSPNGNLLASGGWDKKVQLWDAQTLSRTALDTLSGHKGYVLGVAFRPDSKMLAASTWAEGTPPSAEIKLWDISTTPASLKSTITAGKGHLRSVAYSPDSLTLAAGSNDTSGQDNYVRLWDANNAEIATLPTTAGVNSIAFDSTGRILVVGISDTKDNLVVWECK